jgi:diguanylate cyclase (GGDEF)-like protein
VDSLNLIHQGCDKLHSKLSVEEQKALGQFLETIDELELRMQTVDENMKKVFLHEKTFFHTAGQLMNISSENEITSIHNLVIGTCLEHYQFYIDAILAQQVEVLARIQEDAMTIFATLEDRLNDLGKTFTPDQQIYVEKLISLNFDLRETIQTLLATRIVNLEKQHEIILVLEKMSADIVQDSLNKNNEASTLINISLAVSRHNLLIMSVSLVGAAIMFFIIVFFLHQKMIVPLGSFIELLRRITRLLAGMRGQQVAEDGDMLQLDIMANTRTDEIGVAADAVRMLTTRLRELSLFRQTIEADENTEDIYARLAQIFEHKLGLERFVILEQLEKDAASMAPVYCNPPELASELPEFAVGEHCRARRTGLMITSLETPSICKEYPFADLMDHICIPMIVGGHIIGIIQFLFPLYMSRNMQHVKNMAVEEARYYIAEALPVLQTRHLMKKLEDMATKDPLTGLYNRRYLDSVIEQMIAGVVRRKSTIGVLMCDIDHFKRVNDLFGHETGDFVLIQLARICQTCARDADLVIRYGGEEFLILLPDCDEACAAVFAERIRITVEAHKVHTPNRTLQQTISIGVAEFSHATNKTIWEIIKLADIALYQAKNNGRNQILVCQDNTVSTES